MILVKDLSQVTFVASTHLTLEGILSNHPLLLLVQFFYDNYR